MTNGAIALLYSIVSSAAWTTTVKQIFTAGKLAVKLQPIIDLAPAPKGTSAGTNEERTKWEKESTEFVLDDPSFQVAIEAVNFFASKGAIPPGAPAVELLTMLKLTE